MAKAAKALAQSVGDDGRPRAVTISGAPQEKYNGKFGPKPDYKGWPRWGNEGGMHLYHQVERSEWQLATAFEPEKNSAVNTRIECTDGLLPVGAHAWKFWNTEKKGFNKSDDHILTIAFQ